MFLRLRRLKEGAEIKAFIEENLKDEGLIDRIAELREIPNLVLILDGFDELVMASRSRFREFFGNLRVDLTEGPLRRAKAIVSGRDTLFPGGAGLPPGSHVINLLPFDRVQIQAWGEKWRALHEGDEGASFQPEVFCDTEDRPLTGQASALHHLVSWPLTLHLVARVQNAGGLRVSGGSIKDIEKAYLYRSILALTAQRQEEIPGKGRLSDRDMRRFLRAIAWQMYAKSRDSLDYNEVEPIVNQVFPSASESDRPNLAELNVVNAPELKKGEEKGFEFVHKSFSEFLVGEKISETMERVCFKSEDFDTESLTWRMSVSEAANALAGDLGIRLLPAEVQEMMEPMIGDFRAFSSGTALNDTLAREKSLTGLTKKVERLGQLVVSLAAGECTDDVDRATMGSPLVGTRLEAYSNFAAGLLVTLSAVANRLNLARGDAKVASRARVFQGNLWRLIHLIEAGGVSIDRPLAQRLFCGLELEKADGKDVVVLYPPVPPISMATLAGVDFPISKVALEALIELLFSRVERILYSWVIRVVMGDREVRMSRDFYDMRYSSYGLQFGVEAIPLFEHAGLISLTGSNSARP